MIMEPDDSRRRGDEDMRTGRKVTARELRALVRDGKRSFSIECVCIQLLFHKKSIFILILSRFTEKLVYKQVI